MLVKTKEEATRKKIQSKYSHFVCIGKNSYPFNTLLIYAWINFPIWIGKRDSISMCAKIIINKNSMAMAREENCINFFALHLSKLMNLLLFHSFLIRIVFFCSAFSIHFSTAYPRFCRLFFRLIAINLSLFLIFDSAWLKTNLPV